MKEKIKYQLQRTDSSTEEGEEGIEEAEDQEVH